MQNARILLVEDERGVLDVNARFLAGKGYEVLCAETLSEARALFWESPPDLILLDVLLPDGSGYDFCREVRATSSAPVIYLSCLGEDEHIVSGLCEGDDYMVKPYSLEVMGARVAARLRRNGTIKGRIELPPLMIDLASGNVELNGEAIALTRKEFKLLVYLVENRGRALSQAEIFRAVWEAPPETAGNAVKVNISRLRQKLRLDDASPFELCTVHGRGYMFLHVRYPEEA